MKTEIEVYTGSEWHSSYGAKGHVFLVNHETHIETFLTDKDATLTNEDWYDVVGGTHGKWRKATYELEDGSILKLLSMGTRRGVPYDGGTAYVQIDVGMPRVKVEGQGYRENVGYIIAPCKVLTMEECKEIGIVIDAKHKKYFMRDISIETP